MAKENKPARKEIPEELQDLEHQLKTISPKIFKGIPVGEKEEILERISYISIKHTNHSGPLPDAETLIQYNTVIPDGADRIMKMAEKEQEHRVSIQSTIVKDQNKQSQLGQIFGFIIGLVGIGSGTYLAANGNTTVGGIIAGGTVVSLVSVFVIGKNLQKKSSKKRKKK